METPHENVSEEDNKDMQVTSKLTRNSKSLTDDWGAQEAGKRSMQAGRTDGPQGWVGVCLWARRRSGDKAGERLHGRRRMSVRDGPGAQQSRHQRSHQCQGHGAGAEGSLQSFQKKTSRPSGNERLSKM